MDIVFAIVNDAALLFWRVNIELIVVPGMEWHDLLDCFPGLIIITTIFNDNS